MSERMEKVPAGVYVIGDPCYAIRDEDWLPLLESCDYFNESVGEINGTRVVAFPTAYGDGVYKGTDGYDYGVDAGLIGLVPLEYLKGEMPNVHASSIIVFAQETSVWDDGGVLHFGHVVINTTDEEEDDESYWEDEEEDDDDEL